jgi:hypothetical protein
MTILYLADFRRHAGQRHAQRRPAAGWRRAEMAELYRLFAVLRSRRNAASVELDSTELGDPQFYVLGGAPDHACLAFVSRLSRGAGPWYVAQDGSGNIVGEGRTLGAVIDLAVPAPRAPAALHSGPGPIPPLSHLVAAGLALRLLADQVLCDVSGAAADLAVGLSLLSFAA